MLAALSGPEPARSRPAEGLGRCGGSCWGGCWNPARGGCVPSVHAGNVHAVCCWFIVQDAAAGYGCISSQKRESAKHHHLLLQPGSACNTVNFQILHVALVLPGLRHSCKISQPLSAISTADGSPFAGSSLPLQLCQGYTVELRGRDAGSWHADLGTSATSQSVQAEPGSFSMLGSYYAAAQGVLSVASPKASRHLILYSSSTYRATYMCEWRKSWFYTSSACKCRVVDLQCDAGPGLVVGATKTYGLSPQQSLQECGRAMTAADLQQAAQQLLPGRSSSLQPDESLVRSGVRALPPRTDQGSMPIAGRLNPDPAHSRWVLQVHLRMYAGPLWQSLHFCMYGETLDPGYYIASLHHA